MTATSGPPSSEPFAYYDPHTSSWKTSQATFPWDSGEYSETWPKQGTTHNGCAYAAPMSAPPTAGNGSLSLLPTPNAEESTPTDQYIAEMINAAITPDQRLYLPGRKWHSQRTLSRIAPTLLPTPRTTDG